MENDINDSLVIELVVIDTILAKIEAANAARSSTEESIAELQTQMRNAILQGETTGDQIKDFLIVTTPENNHATFEKVVRPLQKTVNDNVGKLVLVVSKRYEWYGKDDCFNQRLRHTTEKRYELGEITGELELNFREPSVNILTTQHARKDQEFWELQEGPIKFNIAGWPFGLFSLLKMKEDTEMDILTGAEVDSYFRIHPMLSETAVELAKKITAGKHVIRIGDNRVDPSYVKALELLGLKAPEDFKAAYDKEIYEHKVHILTELEKLTTKEQGKDQSRGHERYHLKEIKDHLENAVELGMHHEELILQWNKPGISLNIAEYINNLCREYEVNAE